MAEKYAAQKANEAVAEEYIKIVGLHKTFLTQNGALEVLRGVNLAVRRGEIFGIIGFSGAGKSTLARCINRLEVPDAGEVVAWETCDTVPPGDIVMAARFFLAGAR